MINRFSELPVENKPILEHKEEEEEFNKFLFQFFVNNCDGVYSFLQSHNISFEIFQEYYEKYYDEY